MLLLERLGEQRLTASIPGACNGWSKTQAVCRFLAGEGYDWRGILKPHRQGTRTRMTIHPVVLCLRDRTALNLNGQAIAGLGPLSYEARRGSVLAPDIHTRPRDRRNSIANVGSKIGLCHLNVK